MTATTGGCLCGAVRYEFDAAPAMAFACHCRACQYVSGGSPTLGIVVPKAALKITKGATQAYWSKADSGAGVGRNFCPGCGTSLFSELEGMADIVAVKVGGLDDPSAFAVQADMWMSQAQPWHRPHEGAAQFPANPG